MANRPTEVAAFLADNPPLGRAHRRGKGLIESNEQLNAWAEELLTLSESNPAIGPVYIAKVLRALSKKHGLGLEGAITDSLLHNWWTRKHKR